MNYALPLFAYGTLMFPQVIRTVINRVPKGIPAVARGYARLEVIGQAFPGLVEDETEGATVKGLLYENLSEAEWADLNEFEDTFYVLTEIAVDRDGEVVRALTYLVAPSERGVLSGTPWDEALFREKHLNSFFSAR
jgi:gamma-glutamylcyclotransferase (GGCT)/AIG2-like uncharacterized protein YtfP